MDKTAILVGVVLLLAALVCAQVDYTSQPFLIPPQAIVSITPMQFSSGLGLITPQVHAATIRDAASRTPIFAQSIVGVVPAYGLLGTVKPLNIPLVWWAIGILLLIVSFISARSLRGRAIQELPIANAINTVYVYIIAAFIMIILWLGTGSQFGFAYYYLGANVAALSLLDWIGKKQFTWYQDFKMGLAMDSSIFGFQLDSAVRIMMMGAGVLLMMLYMASGNAYIASPSYSAGTSTMQTLTATVPILPEDILWFRLIPIMLLVLFMKTAFWLINAFGDGQKRSLFENRNNTPKLYLSIFLVGVVLVSAFNGTVWETYHENTYGAQASVIAQNTGRPVEEVKNEMLNSVSNFGVAGSFITLLTGNILVVDAIHVINNLGVR